MNDSKITPSKITGLLWCLYVLMSLVYLIAGSLHLDEGAYLYASQSVYAGNLPYRDFFFLQPPLHPYIYGLIQLFLPGLLFARLTSIVFGILTTVFLMRLAQRLSNKHASMIFLAMMTMTPFQLYFFSITRLYSLTAFFISAGLLAVFHKPKPAFRDSMIGLTFLALAFGTRLTTAPIFCLATLYVIIKSSTIRSKLIPPAFAGLVVSAIYLPFIVGAGLERFWFNIAGMNLSLHAENPEAKLIQKARATLQLIRFYFPIWIMLIPTGIVYIKSVRKMTLIQFISSFLNRRQTLWLITITTVVLHSAAKLYQVSYQTIIMPILLCLVAVGWQDLSEGVNRGSRKLLRSIFIALWILGILAYGRTSISIIQGKPAIFALWKQAEFVKKHTQPDDMIFTADSALVAAESKRRVLKGMSGSDLFAFWTTEKCQEYNVLNFDILTGYVNNHAGAMLISGDLSFNLSLPFLDPVPDKLKRPFNHILDREYEIIGTFPNLTLPGTNAYYRVPKTKSAVRPRKLLIFGIDALGWDVLLPLVMSGELPNIEALHRSGAAAHMKTLEPTVSVMLWTTIATGLLPERHGISNWLSEAPDSSGQQAITSHERKADAFWNLTNDRKVCITNWWATWPVEKINGVMISNRAHFPKIEHAIYPPEKSGFLNRIQRLSVSDLEKELSVLNPLGNPIVLEPFYAVQLQKDQFYLEAARQSMLEEQPDIAAVFVRGIDILQHEYLRDVRTDVTTIPDIPEKQKGIVQAYYRYLDQWLGTYLEIMGPGTGVLIVSDHGMEPVVTLPPLVEGLSINKLLDKIVEIAEPPLKIDNFLENNRYPPGLKRGISWNGPDPVDMVSVNKLSQILRSLTFNDVIPLFKSINLRSDSDEVIELMLNPGPEFHSQINLKEKSFPVMSVTSMIIHPRAGQHWHSPDGVFLMSGPGVESSTHIAEIGIVDIMPTFMAWMGLPVALDLDGKPQTNFFTEEFRQHKPVQYIDHYSSGRSVEAVAVPAEVDTELRRELESLGYLRVE